MELSGLILALIILAAYIGILVELKHIAEKLEEGRIYSGEEQTVRISNGKCVGCAVVLTVCRAFSAYLFLDSYHMEWTMVKESQDPVSEEIKRSPTVTGTSGRYPEMIWQKKICWSVKMPDRFLWNRMIIR